MNNQGVPVTVMNAANCSPLSTIVQRPLSLVQSLDVSKIISAALGEPLMRVTLTRFPDGSNSIGVATWHPLGSSHYLLFNLLYVFDECGQVMGTLYFV